MKRRKMWFDEELIAAIRENEILFDVNNSGYKRTDLKERIWKQIAARLNSTDERCKTRWKSLRDTFKKIHRAKSLPSKAGGLQPMKKWKYYNHLKFLKDFQCSRQMLDEHDIGEPSTKNSTAAPCRSPNADSSDSRESDQSQRKVSEYLPTVSPTGSASSQPKPHIENTRRFSNDENLTDKFSAFLDQAKQAVESFREESATEKYFKALAARIEDENLPPLVKLDLESRITTLVHETIAQHMTEQNKK